MCAAQGPLPCPAGLQGASSCGRRPGLRAQRPSAGSLPWCRILPVPGLGVHVMERLTIFPKVKILVCSGKDFGGY